MLQKSKVATPEIFQQNTKQETMADLYILNLVAKSPASLT